MFIDLGRIIMINIKSLLGLKSNNEKDDKLPVSDAKNVVADLSNWYADRYGSILIQRNILLIFIVAILICLAFAILMLGKIAVSHKIEPLVIQIEDKTGIPSIVNPLAPDSVALTGNEALNRYFIVMYIRNRETYCANSYEYNYRTVVRLLSAPDVYSSFINSLNSDKNSPLVIYGNSICTDIELRSILPISSDAKTGTYTVQIRFNEVGIKGQQFTNPKLATLTFSYPQNQMTLQDRLVNPLGFRVTSYSSSDEVSIKLN